jgi:PrtD family type I secretion system ABC transporter
MAAFLKKWKKFFTFAALLSCFVNILQLTFPFYMFTIYSNIVISFSVVSLANITTAAFFAIMVLGLFSYLRSRLLACAGNSLNLELRRIVFANIIKGCVIDNKKAYQGGMNDLETLQKYFASPSIYALFDVVWAPFFLALIYLINPVLGTIATLGAAILVGLSVLQEKLVRKSMRDANNINSHNLRFVDSFLRNSEVINGMGMIGAISDRFVVANNRVMMNQTVSSNYAGAIQAMIKPLQNVIQVLIYCSGAYYAMTQGFNVGLMVAASIIMGRGVAPLTQLMSSWQLTNRAWEAYRRLDGFLSFYQQQTPAMSLPKPQGHINVEKAFFKVADRVLVNGVSFALNPGEFLGIIGPSGAGKTTLCRLLLGILPSLAGKVYLDGRDIFSWNKEEVGPYIGYLPQEIELFPGTVAENIARLGKVDMAAVEQAIALCGIEDMVENFPQGLQTQLEGTTGLKLSGGQKQKIGLARAVYQQPRVLVLDEPTSNLDEQGEQHLLNTLLKMKQTSCTCIMVTHKPTLLQSMDKVLVLQNGRVALFGPKDAVFAKLNEKPVVVSTAPIGVTASAKVS